MAKKIESPTKFSKRRFELRSMAIDREFGEQNYFQNGLFNIRRFELHKYAENDFYLKYISTS
jgi:hypothetical protein